mmetsp:Transcript_7977/g.17771  ORF Transcript_7977/g.17771 Transcript_7977/m.17771 type:complete len:87 (-) Transcript_7977:588-848(-)
MMPMMVTAMSVVVVMPVVPAVLTLVQLGPLLTPLCRLLPVGIAHIQDMLLPPASMQVEGCLPFLKLSLNLASVATEHIGLGMEESF